MLIQSRDSARRFFTGTWHKYLEKSLLQPLEQRVLEVILEHPEYHGILSDPKAALTEEYLPDGGRGNPFLHMGMHMAIREQVSTDRPAGIAALYQSLLVKHGADRHAVEHLMHECLGEILWTAQRDALPPDQETYLECLRRLL